MMHSLNRLTLTEIKPHKHIQILDTNTTLTCLDGVSWGEREASLAGRPPEDRDCNKTQELGNAGMVESGKCNFYFPRHESREEPYFGYGN